MSAAEPNRPPASVVIRNRNERTHLEQLLCALSLQTVQPEVVVVDNESTDGSAEMAAARGAKVIHLAKDKFTYGHAINVGVANAAADIIVMLSSHSLPLGDRFIEECLKPFRDQRMAAARCLRPERSHFWLNPPVLEGAVTWDDICALQLESNGCALRKSVWQAIPFDEELESCEDFLWCYRVLHAGYRIGTACAWYQYAVVPSFWLALRKNRWAEVSFYRISKRRMTPPDVIRRILYVAPREGTGAALKVILKSLNSALAPWYARRPPRIGSLR